MMVCPGSGLKVLLEALLGGSWWPGGINMTVGQEREPWSWGCWGWGKLGDGVCHRVCLESTWRSADVGTSGPGGATHRAASVL